MKGPIAWMQRRRGRNAAPVDGYTGPRAKVAVVGFAVARHLPELPACMSWAVEYVPDSSFRVWLCHGGHRTRLAAMAPMCELRAETVICMAREVDRKRRQAGMK